MIKDKFGIYWDLPKQETCRVCGQPDNCGDCNHKQLDRNDVAQLGGMKSFWISPRPILGVNIFGYEADPTHYEDNEMNDLARSDGYIYGKWFSIRCPYGELGSQHISRCLEVDPLVFLAAKETNWSASLTELVGIINSTMSDYRDLVRQRAESN